MSELSNEARALIERAGTLDGPTAVDRARVKRRIIAGLAGAGMVFGSGGTIASGAPAAAFGAVAAGKVTVTSVALWLATGAGLGTVVSAPALVSAYRRAEPTAPAVSAPLPAKPPDASTSEPPSGELSATTGNAPAEPALPRVTDERGPSAERPRSSTGGVGGPSNGAAGAASLAEETRLLEAAQRELAQRRTAAALALLDEHAAKFPRGALAQERTGARVLALCDLGRVAEARRTAAAFIRLSPHSPLVPRLRASCAGPEATTEAGEQ